ncbi:MAG: sulfur carrier protein ThiS [Alphaproteobacteria bacterium]|nr:sulfur carrier protein ThiS [Alphaproteobacteria bacterium]
MEVTINGEPRGLEGPLTVAGLLDLLGLAGGKVAVERNLEIVPRSTYGEVAVADGDRYEIVRFIGGG